MLLAALPCLLAAAPPLSIKDVVPNVSGKVAVKLAVGGQAVAYGQSLKIKQVATPPTVSFNGTAGKLYTLLMVDADAPSPTNRVASPFLVRMRCSAQRLLPEPPEHHAPWLTRAACHVTAACRGPLPLHAHARAALAGDEHPRPQQCHQGQRGRALH